MSDRLHIIIAGDKGKPHNLLFSKRRLKLACLATAALLITLSCISYKAYHLFHNNRALTNQLSALTTELSTNKLVTENLALQVQDLEEQNSTQEETFQLEKATLLNTAVSELEERSDMIERIMDNIGVDVKEVDKNNNNSGGPFIAAREEIGKELIFRSDLYLEAITYLPLGRPIPGLVTSRFGRRIDPVNGKKGFHSGVDMRGAYGQKIMATADGVVRKAFVNGSYGKYVEINHGNGYTTKFAHMKKILVKRGDKVKRGQYIGIVGNSGRSTGPHLHYEVCFNKKPINPSKFLRVDKLIQATATPKLNARAKVKVNKQLLAKKQTPSPPAALEN